MKKILSILMVILLLSTLTIPVLAANDNNEKSPSFFSNMAQLFKSLFVPSDHYFYNKVAELNNNVNKKLGGVAQLYHIIENFFKSLNMPDNEANLSFELPNNWFYDGYKGTSLNLFSMAKPFIRLLKDVFNVCLCILTAIVCYHKLRGFFTEQES